MDNLVEEFVDAVRRLSDENRVEIPGKCPIPKIEAEDFEAFASALWNTDKTVFTTYYEWLASVLRDHESDKPTKPETLWISTMSATLELILLRSRVVEDELPIEIYQKLRAVKEGLLRSNGTGAKDSVNMVIISLKEETLENIDRDTEILNDLVLNILEETCPGTSKREERETQAGHDAGMMSQDRTRLKEKMERALTEAKAQTHDILHGMVTKPGETGRRPQDDNDQPKKVCKGGGGRPRGSRNKRSKKSESRAQRVSKAWQDRGREIETKKQLADELGMDLESVKRDIDMVRKREERNGKI